MTLEQILEALADNKIISHADFSTDGIKLSPNKSSLVWVTEAENGILEINLALAFLHILINHKDYFIKEKE